MKIRASLVILCVTLEIMDTSKTQPKLQKDSKGFCRISFLNPPEGRKILKTCLDIGYKTYFGREF